MPEFTTNQWVILLLVFLLGWFLGLFTLAGGRKWRQGFERERAARLAAEAEVERLSAAVAELEQERDRRIELERERNAHIARAAAANDRIAQLEKGRSSVNPETAGAIAAAAAGKRDDLSMIYGVGRGGEIKLNELGIHRYADIMAMSPNDEASLEGRLGLAPGTIADERWREQADMLKRGKFDDHARLFA